MATIPPEMPEEEEAHHAVFMGTVGRGWYENNFKVLWALVPFKYHKAHKN